MPNSGAISAARKVRIIGMDVDGVLTNGDIVILDSGEEVKTFNAKDRLLIAAMRDLKIPIHIAWITGRSSRAVTKAARNLGVSDVAMNSRNKTESFKRILQAHKLTFKDAAFIGDDLIDLSIMSKVGFAACPADAVPEIQKKTHYRSRLSGGRGAVRDVLEFILKAQGQWAGIVSFFAR